MIVVLRYKGLVGSSLSFKLAKLVCFLTSIPGLRNRPHDLEALVQVSEMMRWADKDGDGKVG